MIKAIAFDFGGVIVNLDMPAAIAAYRRLGFADVDQYLDPYFQRGFFYDMECGAISEQEFLAECRKHCRPGTTDDDIRAAFIALIPTVNVQMLDFIIGLKKSTDCDLYIMSNNNPIGTAVCRRIVAAAGLDFDSTFKKTFFSHIIKLCKPTDEFFQYAISEIGCRPEEILFIDDSVRNVEAARRNGINALLFKI